ncbi:anti-sigma-28 factor, FlgM family [Formivibrio citricus]|uniref:Negative regulator of flagellin synthesis n=1 Tax=Formivibrio citricus TaxID=83765 RepID=A0A1I4VCG5_9NEIS|nr:flagellar biosynthesis anti-sigma factor FlgM [Formivibrio citricus]SFM98780.1 anti-sigma-28 factor, FlgM family [Formivibrio citricus]
MKIDNSAKPLAGSVARPASGRASASKTSDSAQQESVSINPLAAKLQAMEAGSATATFDADKVSAIRQAIAEGKFSIRADAIADKLVASVQELLQE